MDLKEVKDDELMKKIKMKRQHYFKIIEKDDTYNASGFSSLTRNLVNDAASILEGKKPSKKDDEDEKEIKIGKEKTEVDVEPKTKNPDEDDNDDDDSDDKEKDKKDTKKKMKKEEVQITESLIESIKKKYLSEPKFPSKIKTSDDSENSLNKTTKYVTD